MEETLRKLVAFPTVSGNQAAVKQLLDYVDDFVSRRGMHVERYEWNGFESLVATVKPGYKTPKVMLAAHADVVAGDSSMFSLQIKDGRYIGRGVLDMKFALAAYLQIIDNIKDRLEDYDIGLMITSDEEVSGANGTSKLIDQGYLPAVCLLPDGGDNWQVQTGSKGVLRYDIRIAGKTAHGSRPWLGDNALTKLLTLLDEIAALFPKIPSHQTSTISLTQMQGGESANQIPGQARMAIDVRAAGSEDYQRLSGAIPGICAKHKATYSLVAEGAPTTFDLQDPYIAPFVQLVGQVTGRTIEGSYTSGTTDARFFVPFGVPCIIVYPEGGGHHGPDEWLSVDALEQFRVITEQYLNQIAVAQPH